MKTNIVCKKTKQNKNKNISGDSYLVPRCSLAFEVDDVNIQKSWMYGN